MWLFISGLCFTEMTQAKTCIISSFDDSSAEGGEVFKLLHQLSRKQPDIFENFFPEADLTKISNCFLSSKYTKIVWLSHAALPSSETSYSVPVITMLNQRGNKERVPLILRFFQNLAKNIGPSSSLKEFDFIICGVDYAALPLRDGDDVILYRSSMGILIDKLLELNIIVESPSGNISSFFADWLTGSKTQPIDYDWLEKKLSY